MKIHQIQQIQTELHLHPLIIEDVPDTDKVNLNKMKMNYMMI